MGLRLVLIRHGESEGNQAERFAGWDDVPLSPRGIEEARAAGEVLRASGLPLDLAHTSVLRRSRHTLELIQEGLGRRPLPTEETWRLNERHYGALQGRSKAETLAVYGPDLYRAWRRSWDQAPPPLDDARFALQAADPRYQGLSAAEQPRSESLQACVARLTPWWTGRLVPQLRAGRRPLVCAHGSTVRGLAKLVLGLSDAEIETWDVPNAVPLVLDLDANLTCRRWEYLGDADLIARKIEAVRRQGTGTPV